FLLRENSENRPPCESNGAVQPKCPASLERGRAKINRPLDVSPVNGFVPCPSPGTPVNLRHRLALPFRAWARAPARVRAEKRPVREIRRHVLDSAPPGRMSVVRLKPGHVQPIWVGH